MPSESVASSSLSKPMSPAPLFTSDFDSELFEVLFETNLLQYYHNFAVDLKIYSMADLRNLTDSELDFVGLNSVEIRRLRRVVKKDSGHKPFFRFRKKFSFRASSRLSFDASGSGRLSLFNPTSSHGGSSQDDSSSLFRASSSASGTSSVRHSARHFSMRCGPAPPLIALLDPDLVTLIPSKILGEGEFATVYQGVLRKDAVTQDKMTVAVKKFAPNCLGRPLHVFLQHVALLSDLRHSNLLHVFGCYTDEYCQPALVCELASLRSLIDVFSDPDLRVAITPLHLCRYAEQIAAAMAYLEKRHVVHGDLACRNVMLSNISINAQIKIADYGLLKALGVLLSGNNGNSSHQTPPSSSANSDDANSTSTDHSKLRLPVAWCAPETIRAVEMTSSSDIWSFGVTLWEMFSYGEQPWSQLSATEILDVVDAPCGQRLTQPDYCPRDYYDDIMLQCWRHNASERPTFAYLEQHMPLVRPDQVQTVKHSSVIEEEQDEDFVPLLAYSKGEIFTVLDKRTAKQGYWKGVTGDGCLGYFNAGDVVFYTDLLAGGESATLRIGPTPPLVNQQPPQITFLRPQNKLPPPPPSPQQEPPQLQEPLPGYLVISPPPTEEVTVVYQDVPVPEIQQSSKMPNESKKHRFGGVIPSIGTKTIDSSMISLPRGDLRHIGHIGFDGAVSGHVDFIAPGVERVTIERTSQSGTLPKQGMKRTDSFEEGFHLPDLSLESEVQELISTIRLSDFLATSHPSSENVLYKRQNETLPPLRGSASSLSKIGPVTVQSVVPQIESLQSMRQPRQPSGLLSTFDKVPSPVPLTMAFCKQPVVKELSVEPPVATQMSSLLPGSSSSSTTTSSTSSPSSCSSGSPCPPTSSIPTSSPPINELTPKVTTESSNDGLLSSWRYVDSPPAVSDQVETRKVSKQEESTVTVTTTTTIVGNQVTQSGQRRASIVTAEERQRVYDEVRQKCGHPLLMSDCLRAVSYTQGNVDAAVKFLKLQYLASHRVAEVERCKNALVACDWEVDRALEMLRLRSSGESSAAANFLTTPTPSDAVNV